MFFPLFPRGEIFLPLPSGERAGVRGKLNHRVNSLSPPLTLPRKGGGKIRRASKTRPPTRRVRRRPETANALLTALGS
jgi:hypothetical protein